MIMIMLLKLSHTKIKIILNLEKEILSFYFKRLFKFGEYLKKEHTLYVINKLYKKSKIKSFYYFR